MDRQFLLEATKGYLTNHNVYENNSKDIEVITKTIYNELIETIDLIYDVDEDLYEEIKHMKKTDQYRIFEIYLDSSYKLKPTEPVNEGVIGTLAGWVGSMLGGIWNIAISLPLSIQWPITVLTLVLIGMHREPITRNTFRFLTMICNQFDKLGKFLRKGRFTKFRLAVIQQNVEKCYKQCGITNLKKDISFLDYFNKHAGDRPTPSNAKCLINCYIQHEIAKVKIVTKMYFSCLRATQNFDNIKNLNSDKILSMLIKNQDKQHRSYNFGMQTACAEYFDVISDSISKLHDLIEFFYEDRTTRQELIMMIQKDIDQVKHDVLNMNQQQLRQYTTR